MTPPQSDDFHQLAARLRSFASAELGTGANAALIANAEAELGVPITGGYRRFLKDFGWGGVAYIELFGLGGPPHLDLVELTRSERFEAEPSLPRNLLPVMNDGAGNHYCVAVSESDEPPVVFWDHEAGRHQAPAVVATSFVVWLNSVLDEVGR